MSNNTTKRCSQCRQFKSLDAFYKCTSAKDGLQNICKDCKRDIASAYRKTERGKEKNRNNYARWSQTEKGKRWIAEYTQSEHGKSIHRRSSRKFAQTEHGKQYIKEFRRSELGRELMRQWEAEDRQKHPLEHAARKAVQNAIANGTLPHPTSLKCNVCGKDANEYHHPSYSQDKWLDVKPLCVACHKELHRQYE